MANNTISSEQLKTLLEVNSKSIELHTVVTSQFEDINKDLELLKESNKEIKSDVKDNQKILIEDIKNQTERIEALEKSTMRLNVLLGSNVVAAVIALIILILKLLLGVP